MIAYFAASALVPLVVDEPGTPSANALWTGADRVVTVRLTQVEAHAALAHAARLGRLTRSQHGATKSNLMRLLGSVDWIEVDPALMTSACELAEQHALRAYDAVHLAAAERLGPRKVVVVAGDRAMLAAARSRDLATAAIP